MKGGEQREWEAGGEGDFKSAGRMLPMEMHACFARSRTAMFSVSGAGLTGRGDHDGFEDFPG